MPRKNLHGRTCSVSREGGRARALQPSRRSAAMQMIYPYYPTAPRQQKSRVVASFRCSRKLS
ncbi:hypothetical protein E1J23_04640 [Xanthomonas gardneri]|nr:hypothetical protein BJD10_17545 [Xanthomonas hortorum pv. gardneri]NMI17992.1 hypothetical protein [Xanthomonas hortorum pv. vitians]NMI54009.1 hypothetical protein [Xanthomonas hortorum pv. taraxaci]PPU44132.1 hypothetical protein XcyCFBP4188_08425 [Xanthomonas hortorum pv. cynarae]QEW15904.1 hypothetical protein DYQ48_13965 [Xanthomonas hortorum]